MKKTIRKWVLALFIVVFCGLLAINVQKNIHFELGNRPSFALPSQTTKIKNGIIIFCYHRVIKDTPIVKAIEKISPNNQLHVYNVNLTSFKKQMNFLKQNHIKVISTNEMVKMLSHHHPIKGKYVVITFDDIDRTIPENAAPILIKDKFPFTLSVITGETGAYREGEQLATWPQILKMKKAAGNLIEFAVHTSDMHYLNHDKIAIFNLPKNFTWFKEDFALSEQQLKQKTGSTSDIFTYPYGSGTPQVQQFLENQSVLKVIYTLNNGIVQGRSNLMLTPRVIINNSSWPSVSQWLTH